MGCGTKVQSLQLADIYSVIGSYFCHPSEVDEYLHRRAQQTEQIRKGIQARFDPSGIRHRLLARSGRRR